MIPRFQRAGRFVTINTELSGFKINDNTHQVPYKFYFGGIWRLLLDSGQIQIIDDKWIITELYNDSLASVHDIKVEMSIKVNGEEISQIIRRKSIHSAYGRQSLRLTLFFLMAWRQVTVTYEEMVYSRKAGKTYPFNSFGYTT